MRCVWTALYVAVLLVITALGVLAGPDDDWRVYLRVTDTRSNQYSEVCIGTQSGASDEYITGEDVQLLWNGTYPVISSQPYWFDYENACSLDIRAPLQPGQKKEWKINMLSDYGLGNPIPGEVQVKVWNPSGAYDLDPGISLKIYRCTYIDWETGEFYKPMWLAWSADPAVNGSATNPNLTYTGQYECIASPEGEGWLIVAEAVPEPQSIVCLSMGAVLAACRLRRRR